MDEAEQLGFSDGKLDFYAVVVNAYFASVAADFLRQNLIEAGTSFTCETVMSSVDKVCLLQKAQQRGYRTYLYYVATDDPINSKHQRIWLAEITDGKVLEMKPDRMPAWFKRAVWDKFASL